MKKHLLNCMLLSFLFVTVSIAQIALGPATGTIAGGVVVNTASFENVDSPTGPVRVHVHPDAPILPMPANMPPPTAPEGSNYIEDPSVHSDSPLGPPPITLASFQGNNLTNGIPPDPHVAVGPNHIIQVVNSSFRISDKSGTTLRTIQADSWYASVFGGNPGAFDPKVQYDHHANRWLMVWDQQDDATQTGNFLVSVSDDSDPIGQWFNWKLPSNVYGSTLSNSWQDYQGVGYDANAYYIVGRHFTFNNGPYLGNAVRILPKAQFLQSTPGAISWTDFWRLRDLGGNDVDGVRPAIVFSRPNEYYLAGPPSFLGGSYFALYRITNPLTSPAISCVHVPANAWGHAQNASQLGGGSVAIETGGSRIRHEPIYRDSSLWMAHSVDNGGYSAVRYVRINTVTNTTIEDVAFGAFGFWHFYPALAVDKDNNIAITFSRSGETEFVGAYYTWRLNSDPPQQLRPTELIRPGAGNYVVTGGGTRNRWGDYMGAALDPADKSNIWFLTEYASATNQFGVWVHGVRFVPYTGARVASTVASRDFGRIEATRSSDTLEIMVNNVGSTTLSVSNITKSNAAFNLLNLPSFPANLATYDSIKFRIYFRPSAHGVVNDTIRIASNDAGTPVLRIPITGKGIVIGRAGAGILYGVSGPPDSGRVFTINTTTGAATVVGSTGLTEIQSLAIHPTTRELHGTITSPGGMTLYRLSSGFGDALPVRTIPLGNTRAIAFANDGSLYAGNNTGRLYRVNISTGDTIFIGASSGIIYSGLSLNPITGKLWASVRPPITGRDRIYTVNTTDGSTTLVGTTGGGNITPYIAFDARGKLYGIKGTSTQIDTLIVIDTTTAFGTRIGSMGFAGINALVIRTDSVGSLDVRELSTGVPQEFVLNQNYPNPFNPTTQITYGIPEQSRVRLTIFNSLGQEVAQVVDREQSAGSYVATWNATANIASGVYFYKLDATSSSGKVFSQTKKLVLVR